MSNRRRPKGLRAALAAKKIRVESYPIPVVEFPVVEEASNEVKRAEQFAEIAGYGDDEEMKVSAKSKLDEARKNLDACYYKVEFRGLGLSAFDALVNEHPPTEKQAKDGELWNPETFSYALIEACVLDGDGMTADDWKTELLDETRWTRADRAKFVNAVFEANLRDFSDGIPKG